MTEEMIVRCKSLAGCLIVALLAVSVLAETIEDKITSQGGKARIRRC